MAPSTSSPTTSSSSPHLRHHLTLPDFEHDAHAHTTRELNVVFASLGCSDPKIINDLLPQIAEIPDVSLRAILDPGFRGQDFIQASRSALTMQNVSRTPSGGKDGSAEDVEKEAAEWCEWANLLVLAPIDAGNQAKMLHGHTDNLLLEILRSWNVSKKILLVPGMSALMWENPMTKKQLTKIRRKWNWVQVLPPLLWTFSGENEEKKVQSWEAGEELVDAVRNQVDLMNIGQDMEVSPARAVFNTPSSAAPKKHGAGSILPPELWTMIFDFTGDWELAQTLHIFTNLSPPTDWTSHTSPQGPKNYMEALELTILRGNLGDVKHFIATHSVPRWLSKLCIKLIMRFAMTSLLAHLEANHKDLFWATFGHTFLPDKASSVFGRIEILEFWRTSPSFLTKEYNTEALDGASRAGFVNVLEWWAQSSLPLKFTEAAMEQASSQGHIAVLEWWKLQSLPPQTPPDQEEPLDSRRSSPPLTLKPGKSICYATQSGSLPSLHWWLASSIPYAHSDHVPKLASTHNHVPILTLWHKHKGSKMIFDNQVLVGATKNGNVGVLEWWKRSGLKVEFKTCDVEEALEDGVGGDEGAEDGEEEGGGGGRGSKGAEVRRWWARNGLNLGVGTSEWMRTKVLGS